MNVQPNIVIINVMTSKGHQMSFKVIENNSYMTQISALQQWRHCHSLALYLIRYPLFTN